MDKPPGQPASPSKRRRGGKSAPRTVQRFPGFDHGKENKFRRDQARLDNAFRRLKAGKLLDTFLQVNKWVLIAAACGWGVETCIAVGFSPSNATPPPRIVTERVLLALIAATTAQLAALALSVGKSLLQSHQVSARPPVPDAGQQHHV